jgi:predicted nucleic acid-binding protein
MIVVDASVLAPALGDDGPAGDAARGRLRGEQLAAPALIDLEVTSVFRSQNADGLLEDRRASQALDDLSRIPVRRAPHQDLVARCWELRRNLTPYDAAYVALAEALDVPLLTADAKLSRAPGIRCRVEVIGYDRSPRARSRRS